MSAVMKPIRMVHRPDQVAKLTDFFNFESIKDELKVKAQAKLNELKSRVNESSKKVLIHS